MNSSNKMNVSFFVNQLQEMLTETGYYILSFSKPHNHDKHVYKCIGFLSHSFLLPFLENEISDPNNNLILIYACPDEVLPDNNGTTHYSVVTENLNSAQEIVFKELLEHGDVS